MKRTDNSEKKLSRRSAWTGLLMLLVAAAMLEATTLIQFYFAEKALNKEASSKAETQLDATKNKIMDMIDQAEAAVRNSVWIAQWSLTCLDSSERVCSRIVETNPVIYGSTIALVPGYSSERPLFSPYVYKSPADTLITVSLATPEYDYPNQEWFVKPLELNQGYWSEPYVDTGGGEMLMTTYSIPIEDYSGKKAAVLTGDISLDWLSDLVSNINIYPNANTLMLSRTGKFMVSRNKEMVKGLSIEEVMAGIRDQEDFKKVERGMNSGGSGHEQVTFHDIVGHVYYAPVERTGWSMCIIIPDDDIYGANRRTRNMVQIMQLLGLILLIAIVRSLIRSQKKNRALNERKNRMENELHIASDIQMSMVPKAFPAFPERTDLDLYAAIYPAKEVGGDLYDFFIRDEKLYFCIGDVSGKGIPASLVMAVTRSSFRTVAVHESSPKSIVGNMNNSLAEMNDADMFVTFFCGVLNLASGDLKYCNAGHNPPMILTDSIRILPSEPNLPLGVMKDMDFTEQQMHFNYDDALFLYTDGLTEAENINHEQFSEERVEAALHGRKSSEEHLKNIQNKVKEFVGEAPQSDDLTMMFIHFLGKPGNDGEKCHLTLHNKVEEISLLAGFIDEIAERKNLDISLASALNLAMEEAVTNVVLYAYPKDSDGTVDIDATLGEKTVEFSISDSGTPFDPTAVPEADITLSAEERSIGGLGIHLVRNIMDSVKYERIDGKNILTMTKNI
ncbi:MAG: SpoIIE family protein phosphatase [Bacteroidales bacterium]|nr:SpoIIE family protein phosphatase [Bacteroidales bacterium]